MSFLIYRKAGCLRLRSDDRDRGKILTQIIVMSQKETEWNGTDSAQLRAVRFNVEGTERRKSANLRKIPAENSCVLEDIMI